jgi:PST family polysaccharide transporter
LAKTLLSFGSKIIVVGILGFLVTNVGYFLVGRYLGAALLGVYVLSLRIPDVLIRESALVVNRVLFPVFAKVNDDYRALSRAYLFVTRYLSLLVVPLGLGLSAVSEPFVMALLTEKWANAIPVIRLSGLYMLLLALAFGTGTVFKAIGRPGLIIKLSIFRLMILIPAVSWAVITQASLVSALWVQVAAVVLHMLISLYLIARILDFPFRHLIDALWPSFAIGGIMYVGVVLLVNWLHAIHPALQLGAGVVVGAAIYCSLIWWWQRDIVIAGYQQLRAAMASRK